MRFDAIVLAGGAALRLGGVDKPMLDIEGAPMLVHVLDAVAAAGTRVVVGPTRAIDRTVTWCQEAPPGGGPVAGLAAALPLTSASTLIVLAADLPRIRPAINRLLEALRPPADAAMLSSGGRRNHLAAAWHRHALVAALGRVGTARGAAMRTLAAGVTVAEVADAGWGDDCDTWSDLARHRSRSAR
jgi:molybdopterin-guanine dinucleotide biosynthesis protein A